MNPRLARLLVVTAMVLRHSKRNYRIDVALWHAPNSDGHWESVEIWCRNGTADSLGYWTQNGRPVNHSLRRQSQYGSDGIDNAPIQVRGTPR